MFPTPVGMNRMIPSCAFQVVNVPHASGDEPVVSEIQTPPSICSPRQWG